MVNNVVTIIENLRKVQLEASTTCQLKCPSCPTASGRTSKGLKVGFLKYRDFKQFIDVNPQISHVELSNWGEIFLNKEIYDIIKYAYKKNVMLSAGNGSTLNNIKEEVIEALVKYRFRMITCSIDGASQEVYAVYRVNGHFEQVIENIKLINKFKAKYNSEYPLLHWQFIVFGHNENEISTARRMAVDLNMSFSCKLSWEDLYEQGNFSPIQNKDLVAKETGLGVSSRQEFFNTYGEQYIVKRCCLGLWHKPQINFDGKVLGCAINFWGDYGNAFKEGLTHVINNEQIVYARKMLVGEVQARDDIPCARCKVYKIMCDNNAWLTVRDLQHSSAPSKKVIMLENKFLGRQKTRRLAHYFRKAKRIINRDLQKAEDVSRKGKKFLLSDIYPVTLPLAVDQLKGWKPYPIYSGSTKGIRHFSCHISSLIKDSCPHLPHSHREEEILLVLSGEVDLIIPKEDFSGENQRIQLTTGEFVYYPAYFYHTLQTTSEEPANYLMFKWYSSKKIQRPTLFFSRYEIFELLKQVEVKDGFTTQGVFRGKTSFLKKLRCHTSTLTPGAGYQPHSDPYDVAIIVLEGEVETIGKLAKSTDIIFYAAGEKHGIYNPSKTIAKYIVYEFHS